MIVWIDRALVLAIHDRQITEHGGADGVRDEGLLDSTLARPQQMLAYADPEPDLADLATALAYGIARNLPFVDGNKRTAYVALRTFLVLNGTDVVASTEDRYAHMLALAEGRLSASEFSMWLRMNLSATGVQEPRLGYAARTRKPVARKSAPRARR
jgi:death-on-curing protein